MSEFILPGSLQRLISVDYTTITLVISLLLPLFFAISFYYVCSTFSAALLVSLRDIAPSQPLFFFCSHRPLPLPSSPFLFYLRNVRRVSFSPLSPLLSLSLSLSLFYLSFFSLRFHTSSLNNTHQREPPATTTIHRRHRQYGTPLY